MTTSVKVKGVKRYRHPKSKRWYAYHRASGKRIEAEFGTAEFFQQLAEIERATKIAAPIPGSLGLVISEYMRSPDWTDLRPATKTTYERAFTILKPLADMPLSRMDRAFILQLRDKKLRPKYGVWTANYVVTVMSVVFGFSLDRGWIKQNPLGEKVRKIKAARTDEGAANRPWTESECRVVLDRAPPHIRLPIAVAMCAGLRKSDFLSVKLSAVKDGSITVRTSKRGVPVSVPVHRILADAIAASHGRTWAGRRHGESSGAPWRPRASSVAA